MANFEQAQALMKLIRGQIDAFHKFCIYFASQSGSLSGSQQPARGMDLGSHILLQQAKETIDRDFLRSEAIDDERLSTRLRTLIIAFSSALTFPPPPSISSGHQALLDLVQSCAVDFLALMKQDGGVDTHSFFDAHLINYYADKRTQAFLDDLCVNQPRMLACYVGGCFTKDALAFPIELIKGAMTRVEMKAESAKHQADKPTCLTRSRERSGSWSSTRRFFDRFGGKTRHPSQVEAPLTPHQSAGETTETESLFSETSLPPVISPLSSPGGEGPSWGETAPVQLRSNPVLKVGK